MTDVFGWVKIDEVREHFESVGCGTIYKDGGEGRVPLCLAQPKQEQGEPVAWMHVMDNTEGIKANGTGIVSITQKKKHPFGKAGVDFSKSYPVTSTPLYTTPPQRTWVGLTDEEIEQSYETTGHYQKLRLQDKFAVYALAKAIEAKLKEKNT